MKRIMPLGFALAATVLLSLAAAPQSLARQSLTWDQVKAQFEAANPTLKADALSVDEMHAAEITAFLRPNPQFTFATDGTQIAPNNGVWQPFTGTQYQSILSYLHERDHKRDLRHTSAEEGTHIAASQHEDLKRNLEFNLRAAFVDTLEAKAILRSAQADLTYYDKIIEISRSRFKAGDMAQIDLDRIELLRVQYEVEIQSAIVNLRTAKIQLLQLLDDRTPVEQFDVTGAFDFNEALIAARRFPPDRSRFAARSARRACRRYSSPQTNHKLAVANGSADPTFSAWYTYNPSFNNPNLNQYPRRSASTFRCASSIATREKSSAR